MPFWCKNLCSGWCRHLPERYTVRLLKLRGMDGRLPGASRRRAHRLDAVVVVGAIGGDSES
jgi:hypothetical protein